MGGIVRLPCRRFHQIPLELIMKAFFERLKEPSTWAGLSVLGVLFGLPAGTIEAAGQVAGGLAALGAILLKERAK